MEATCFTYWACLHVISSTSSSQGQIKSLRKERNEGQLKTYVCLEKQCNSSAIICVCVCVGVGGGD